MPNVLRFAFAVALAGCALLATGGPVRADDDALRVLLNGVERVPAAAAPGLAAYGERSFTVLAGEHEGIPAPAVAAARWRNGRAVVFGHRDLATGPSGSLLLANAVRWCAADHKGALVAVVGSAPVPEGLEKDGFQTTRWSVDDLRSRMEAPDFEVVVVDAAVVTERDGKRMSEFLTAFVKGGGGLVVAGDSHIGSRMRGVASPSIARLENRMLAPMGIGWTGNVVGPAVEGVWSTDKPRLEAACARRALQALWNQAMAKDAPATDAPALTATVASALMAAPREEGWFTARVGRFVERWATRRPAPWGPGHSADKLRAVLAWRRTAQTPPAADMPLFQPGNPFPPVPRVEGALAAALVADVRVPAGFTGVFRTGLAALPGQRITAVPPTGIGSVRVRIGEHPPLPFASPIWERFPEIRMESDLTAGKPVVPVFGGPVALVIERPLGAGDTHVRILGAAPSRLDDGFVPGPLWRESVRGPVRLVAPPGVPVPPDSVSWEQARSFATTVRRKVHPGLPDPEVLSLDPAGVARDRWVGIPSETWELLRSPESPWSRLALADALTAAGPAGALVGWSRFGTAIAAVGSIGDLLPGSGSSERLTARQRIRTDGLPQPPQVLLEMVLQMREAVGASVFDGIRSRVSPMESDPAVWWTAFGEATGKDLRPHWKAFGLPVPPELEGKSSPWQPWTGTTAAVANSSASPGQP